MKTNTFTKAIKRSFLLFFASSFLMLFLSFVIKNSIIYTVVGYLLMLPVTLLLFKDYLKKCKDNFKVELHKKKFIDIILYSILFIALANIANLIIQNIIGIPAANNVKTIEAINKFPLYVLHVVLIGPIIEELIFRAPYNNLNKHKFLIFILYSFIFACVHIFACEKLIELLYIIPYFLLSLGFGFTFYKTDNILLSIIIHIINNFLEIVLLFI